MNGSDLSGRPPTVDGVTAEGEWLACPACRELVYGKRFRRSLRVCPGCGHHDRVGAQERVEQLLDPGSARPVLARETVEDPLGFVDRRSYADRLDQTRRQTALAEAVVCVQGTIDSQPVVVAVMDFRFFGGSLGAAVGERLAAAARQALEARTPLVVLTASGGARMQEGALALMQMVKVTQSLVELDRAGLLTVTVVTDPTYGGVAASFATQADVILAEPGAHLGFAGPRVIQHTIREELPAGLQTAEYLRERGLVDAVVPRAALRTVLGQLLAAVRPGRVRPAAPTLPPAGGYPAARDPWEVVRTARRPDRPTTMEYAHLLLDGFVELRGDRLSADCPALVGGLGRLAGRTVVLIGHQKGHTTAELVASNFGMPSPAGYRKAARLMRLAGKLRVPVVTLIDTPGAHPGVEAERHGQAWAIADCLRILAGLPVPVVAVVTGEGGSGGALALGVADRVLALENAVYSVISPEGCAAILWRDPGAAAQAARSLRLDPAALLHDGVIDAVIPEPVGGAHRDHAAAAESLRRAVTSALSELDGVPPDELRATRARRFDTYGLAMDLASATEGRAA
jgi:acyl-CoA carboxylase subunit beta